MYHDTYSNISFAKWFVYRSPRHVRWVTGAVLGLISFAMWLSQGKPATAQNRGSVLDRIEAREFAVVGANGRDAIRLRTDKENHSLIEVYDKGGNARLRIITGNEINDPIALEVYRAKGKVAAHFCIDKNENPRVTLYNKDEFEQIKLFVDNETKGKPQESGLFLWDKDVKGLVRTGLWSNQELGGKLFFYDIPDKVKAIYPRASDEL